MRKLRATPKGGCSTIVSISAGIIAALIISTLLSAGLTSLTVNGKVKEEITGIYIFIIRALSVLIGSLLGTGLEKGKYLPVISAVTLGYLLVLLGFGITVYNGSFQNFGGGIVSILSGSVIACLIKLKPQKRQKHAVRYAK